MRVTGAEEIALVAAAVRAVGADRKIVNDMAAGIRRGVAPLRKAIRAHEVEVLPSGLGEWMASGRITARVRRGATSAGVTVVQGRNSGTGKRSDLKRLDSMGRVRHLTWGHRPWSAQTVVAGSFSEGASGEGMDQLLDATLEACENAAERIVRA